MHPIHFRAGISKWNGPAKTGPMCSADPMEKIRRNTDEPIGTVQVQDTNFVWRQDRQGPFEDASEVVRGVVPRF